jgi:pimeloyl-ACP methyl ester carboxylesterase
MPEFNYDTHRIHYTDSAAGSTATAPALVFIHGLASSSKIFAGQIMYFHSKYRCIALDIFGHGNSDFPPPESVDSDFYSLTGHAKVIIALLSHLSLEKVTFVGWSLGSAISITLALTYPQVVENLILVAAVPVFFTPENDDFPGLPPSQAKIFLEQVKSQYTSFSQSFVLQQYPEVVGITRPDYVDEALCDAALMVPEVAYAVVKSSGSTDFRPVVHHIGARTLIVNGVDDPFCKLPAGKWMHERLPASSFISYAGCGHVPFVGPFAEKFSADVAAFLENGILPFRVLKN